MHLVLNIGTEVQQSVYSLRTVPTPHGNVMVRNAKLQVAIALTKMFLHGE